MPRNNSVHNRVAIGIRLGNLKRRRQQLMKDRRNAIDAGIVARARALTADVVRLDKTISEVTAEYSAVADHPNLGQEVPDAGQH